MVKPALACAAGLCSPTVALICVLALQELVGSNDAHPFYFLTNSCKKVLEEGCNVFIRDVRVTSNGCDLGTEAADPVIEPARRHTGEGACVKSAITSLMVGYPTYPKGVA